MVPDSNIPFHPVDEWLERFPWLLAGMTHSGSADELFDLRLFGEAPPASAEGRWRSLLAATGFEAVAHARQVHEAKVDVHGDLGVGVHIQREPADGHATSQAGLLLAVTVADCVPVYVVDPGRRVVALLHAGWRGVAGLILKEGLQAIEQYGSEASSLEVHLGPAICGECYEVGPEVFDALGLDVPSHPTPVDVRAVLVEQAVALGIPRGQITVSDQCTLCGTAGLFSHRGMRPERQAALLGIRP
jgi:YfiH family protein